MWDRDITSIKLAKETGINPATISALLHNKRKNVGLKIIDKLCIALDCKISDLLEFHKD